MFAHLDQGLNGLSFSRREESLASIKMSLPQIYCDLDEVLSDFVGRANEVLVEAGLKRIMPQKDRHTEEERLLRIAQFEVIRSIPDFYTTLPWTFDGKELWEYIRPFKPILLSSPSELVPTCADQKREWVRRELGAEFEVHVVPRSEKQRFAHGKALLIDDHHMNCAEFSMAGGYVIRHETTAQTVSWLYDHGFLPQH